MIVLVMWAVIFYSWNKVLLFLLHGSEMLCDTEHFKGFNTEQTGSVKS